MSGRLRRTAQAGVVVALGVVAASGVTANAAAAQHQQISSVQTSIGRVVSSPAGKVMYAFSRDTTNVSHCSSLCQTFWPPVMSNGRPVAGAHISASHLARTAAGQVTYYGHPLYYYVGDHKPKDTNGAGFSGSGGKWYALATNGREIS